MSASVASDDNPGLPADVDPRLWFEMSGYFVRGYLSGNEPPPPRDSENDLIDDHDPAFTRWRRAVEVFRDTGYWWSGDPRSCERCQGELLPSEPGEPPCLNCPSERDSARTDRPRS